MNFNMSDTHVSHRIHLNESNSGNLHELRNEFYEGFSKKSIYPDPGNPDIKEKIAQYHNTDSDNVALGYGVDKVILFCA